MNKKLRTGIAVFCAAVVLPLTMASECGSKTNSTSSPAPASNSTPGKAAAGGGAVPGPNVDAGPVPKETAESTGGNDCNFYYGPDRSGLQIEDHVKIIGTAKVTCKLTPKHLSVIITIYRLAPFSKTYASAAIATGIYPGDLLSKPVIATAPCEPGIYYLEEYGTGISFGNIGFSIHIVGEAIMVPGGTDGPCV